MKTEQLAKNKWHGILQSFGVKPEFLRDKHCACPFCGGKDRYRFDNKEGRGTWICNQCGSGNGFDFLIRYENREFKEIASMVDKIVGNVAATTAPKKRDNSKYLKHVYKNSTKNIAGTPVEFYLNSRGLSIDNVSDIRYAKELDYYSDGKKTGAYPAMVAIYSDSNGKPQTLHVTYLTSDGKKAQVESKRKILSSIEPGGAVRLFDIDENDVDLYIAEGIETALSVAKIHGVKCWAVLNTTLMEQFKPPSHIKNVIICADNDVNYSGQKAAYALANRLMIAGTGALVDVPGRLGSDFNDVLGSV